MNQLLGNLTAYEMRLPHKIQVRGKQPLKQKRRKEKRETYALTRMKKRQILSINWIEAQVNTKVNSPSNALTVEEWDTMLLSVLTRK